MTTLPLHPVPGVQEVTLPPAVPLLQVPTFRNWARTILWTLIVVGLFGIAYVFDKYQGWFEFQQRRAYEYRLFKNPATIAMRAFGIPHFMIAVLFLMSSRRMKEARNRLIFAVLLIASIGICWLFARWGAHLSPFAVFLFYFYFIIHGFRDDSYFYKTYGDMPAIARETHQRLMVVLQLLSVGLLFSLLWPAYAQLAETNPRFADPILGTFFPADWPFVIRLASMFVPMLLIATAVLWRLALRFPGGPLGFWRTHRPILMVYLLTIGIILLAPALGPWTFDLYILMHFVGWYLIALFLIDRHPPKEPARTWWGWMRTTRAGFITLHFTLVAVTLVLMAVSVYGFGRDCTLEKVIGAPGFYYWTIFHVTLSFVPR
jgi:hypothetical protein